MELAAIIFVTVLLLPAIRWIWVMRRDFKAEATARKEKELAALRQPRRASRTPRQAASQVRARAQRQGDPWKSLTPSLVSEAFKKFSQDEAADHFDSSLVSAAFEKFSEGMRVRH
jgi:hypothetical protein